MRADLKKQINMFWIFEEMLELNDIRMFELHLNSDLLLQFLLSILRLQSFFWYNLACEYLLIRAYSCQFKTSRKSSFAELLTLDVLYNFAIDCPLFNKLTWDLLDLHLQEIFVAFFFQIFLLSQCQ